MDDLIRLLIQNDRIINKDSKNLKLTKEESHYLNKVMRIKFGKEIFITNGQGSLWKAKNLVNDFIEIINIDTPYFFQKKENFHLGIAVAVPKNGFEDILKMCTEIGIDFIQPLFSERQVQSNTNFSKKFLRWNSIINESVEQSERLWRPSILNAVNLFDWIDCRDSKDIISISVTRDNGCEKLNHWLKKSTIFWIKKVKYYGMLLDQRGGGQKMKLIFL